MSVHTYQCPNCGAPLSFNASAAKIGCEHCGSKFTIEEINAFNLNKTDETNAQQSTIIDNSASSKTADETHAFESETHGYHCDNCGAEVITEEHTSSGFCYYCHSPVIFSDKFAGDYLPDKIIPFKIDKNQAKEKFLEWTKPYKLLAKGFASTDHLEKITGIYVPFWLAKATAQVDIEGTGERSSSRTQGDKRITTTEIFRFDRRGSIDIEDIKTIASDKVDRKLIYTVESTTKNKLEDFNTTYLAGFFSQKYTIDKNDVIPETERRLNDYVDTIVKDKIGNYQNLKYTRNQRDISINEWLYVLLPIWILTFQFKGKTYVYALNGETGEFFGELPLDKSRLIKRIAIGFVGILLFMIIGGWLLW